MQTQVRQETSTGWLEAAAIRSLRTSTSPSSLRTLGFISWSQALQISSNTSLDRFAAFSERGAEVAGRDATESVAAFFRMRKGGDRVATIALAGELGLDEDLVADLLELGAMADVR